MVVHIYSNCSDTNSYSRHTFYENGQIESQGYYYNNQQEGKFKSWFDNGQLEADWEMKNGKECGNVKCWYKNGQKKKEVSIENGVVNGLQLTWYENGQKESEGRFVNGKRNGLWKYWFENGEYRERNYINDTLNGKTMEILSDKRKVFGQYKSGKEFGLWVWNDSIGNLEQTALFRNGVYDSIANAYYPDGRIKRETNIREWNPQKDY